MMTKKIFTIFAALAFVLIYSFCTSCSQKKTQSNKTTEMEFSESLTSEDTTQMLQLADDCMELLKQQEIDKAIDMLQEYDDSLEQINPLSAETEKRLRRQFQVFPVLKYKREYFSFMEQGLNDVLYKIWFAEEDDPAQNGEPVIKFMFNPIKLDGEWHLCVKRADQSFYTKIE